MMEIIFDIMFTGAMIFLCGCALWSLFCYVFIDY